VAPLAAPPPWLALLVLNDPWTRQGLGLPLVAAGPKAPAQVVIAALRVLLPAERQCRILHRGTHVTAQQFVQVAQEKDFVQLLSARRAHAMRALPRGPGAGSRR
jgi:hypothetical protein